MREAHNEEKVNEAEINRYFRALSRGRKRRHCGKRMNESDKE